MLTADIFGDSHPGAWVMEAIDNKTAAGNDVNNKATKAAMRRILKARAEKCGAVGWTTGQQHITSKANNLADALSRNDYDAFITNAADRGIPGSAYGQCR